MKKYLKIRLTIILILAILLNIACGYYLAMFGYMIHHNSGMDLFMEEFLKRPGTAFSSLFLGKTEGVDALKFVAAIYHNLWAQFAFWGVVAFYMLKAVIKSLRFKQEDASDFGSHGTARWANPTEIKKRFLKKKQGFILGIYQKSFFSKKKAYFSDEQLNKNIAVFGGSGSGKSSCISIPNILHTAETGQASLVITDPKGELYNITAPTLRRHGYQVVCFNLLDMSKSARYNPLDYIENTEQALDLAATIIENTDGKGNVNKDPFYQDAEKAYLSALILYIKEKCPKEQQHLRSVYELGTNIGSDKQVINSFFGQLPSDSEARAMFNLFNSNKSDTTRAGIIMGLGVRLQLWVSQKVSLLTSWSDFDLHDLGRKKVALFLLLPDDRSTYDLLPTLMIDQCIQVLYKQASQKPNGRLQIPVCMILDELANIATINDFERKVSTMRSRGVSVVPIFQSLGQFQRRYDDERWSEILASCDTTLFLGSNDQVTTKYISDELGKTTLMVSSLSESKEEMMSVARRNLSHIERLIQSPDELRRLPKDQLIVMQKGQYPVMLKKCFYFKQPEWKSIPKVDWSTDLPEREDPPLNYFAIQQKKAKKK